MIYIWAFLIPHYEYLRYTRSRLWTLRTSSATRGRSMQRCTYVNVRTCDASVRYGKSALPITTVEAFSAIRNCAACARRFAGRNLQRGDYATAGASFFDKSAALIYVCTPRHSRFIVTACRRTTSADFPERRVKLTAGVCGDVPALFTWIRNLLLTD